MTVKEYLKDEVSLKGKVNDHIVYIITPWMNSEDVAADDMLYVELGADDLDIVELIPALEKEFNIEISDATADLWETVQDVYDTVKKELEKK